MNNQTDSVSTLFVGVREFSLLSGFGQSFIRRLCHTAGFPCVFVGRRVLIHREMALEWILDNKEYITKL